MKVDGRHIGRLVFIRSQRDEVVLFDASSEDAAHEWLLERFKNDLKIAFIATVINTAIKGNVGEASTLLIGIENDFKDLMPFAANAWGPTLAISRPEMDIVWVDLDEDTGADRIYLQEVKTTGREGLSIADGLVSDYRKLFWDDVTVTLQTRLQSIECKLRFEHKDVESAKRIGSIIEEIRSPQTAVGVYLVPTIFHGTNQRDAIIKLLAIRTSLESLGWPVAAIQPWTILLENIDSHIDRLAKGVS